MSRKLSWTGMSGKLLWTGLTFIVALNPLLGMMGVSGSPVIITIGAVVMIIGCILMWIDK
jgi:hypothetical protein